MAVTKQPLQKRKPLQKKRKEKPPLQNSCFIFRWWRSVTKDL